MRKLSPQHLSELAASAIDPEITALNCHSTSGSEIYSRFFASTDINEVSQRSQPDAQWRYIRRAWGHLEHGALVFAGLDPDTEWETEMDWIRVKPTQPKPDPNKGGKPRKYEAPPKVQTRVSYFRITERAWRLVADRYAVAIPENIAITGDGEALGFWAWIAAHPEIPVVVCEGEKKALCLLSHGFAAVSIPGIWNGTRKEGEASVLHPDLMALAHPDRQFVTLFDFETKLKTQWEIFKATMRMGRAIVKAGAIATVACLPGQEKGADDWVKALGNKAESQLDRLIRNALPLKEYEATRRPGESRGLKKYAPNLTVNTRYLSNEVELPESGLVGLKSDMGTGKTELSARWRKANPDARFLNNGHRIALLRNLSGRLGTEMYSALSVGRLSDATALSITIDSLWKLSDQLEKYDCIFVDEATQYLTHLLRSKTCKQHRRDILDILAYFVRQAKLVVLADAHLDDETIDFFARMRPEGEKPYVIQNDWKSGGREVVWYTGADETAIVEAIVQHLHDGGKPIVPSNSKRFVQKLERRLKEEFPEAEIVAIHSGNSGSEEIIDYIVNINERVCGTAALIPSPSLGTGVDITKQHFTAIFGVFRATSATATDCAQQLWRYRPNVPMHVWVDSKPCFGYRDENWELVRSQILGNVTIANRLIGFDPSLLRRRLNPETGKWELEDQWLVDCCARIEATRNRSINRLRYDLKSLLEEMGNTIVREVSGQNEAEKNRLKAAGQELDTEHFQAVANAELIDARTARQLEAKDYLTPEELHKLERWRIEQSYGQRISPELVERDDSGRLIGKIIALEGLLSKAIVTDDGVTLPPALVAERDRAERESTDILWDWRNVSVQWAAMVGLGIKPLLDRLAAGEEFGKKSPELLELAEKAIANRKSIKQTLGITVPINARSHPVKLFGQLLEKLGLKLDSRRPASGSRERIYSLDREKWDFALGVIAYREGVRQEKAIARQEREEANAALRAGSLTQYGFDAPSTTPPNTRQNGGSWTAYPDDFGEEDFEIETENLEIDDRQTEMVEPIQDSGGQTQDSRRGWTGLRGRISEAVSRAWDGAWWARGQSVTVVGEPVWNGFFRRWQIEVRTSEGQLVVLPHDSFQLSEEAIV